MDKSSYEKFLDELNMNAVISSEYKTRLISIVQQITKEAFDEGVKTQKNKENMENT